VRDIQVQAVAILRFLLHESFIDFGDVLCSVRKVLIESDNLGTMGESPVAFIFMFTVDYDLVRLFLQA